MKPFEALRIIQSLIDGVDPCTGELFPDDSPYQQPAILRALFIAVRSLECLEENQKCKQLLPENAGKPWSKSEDKMLCIEFESGLAIIELAKKHRRTLGAIQSRLEKLGKIPFQNQLKSSLSVSIKHDEFLAKALECEQEAEIEKQRKREEIWQFCEDKDEDKDEDDHETHVQEEIESTEEWQHDKEKERCEEIETRHVRQHNEEDKYWDEEDYQTYLEVLDEFTIDQLNYARSEEEGWFYSDSDPDDWCNQSR